MFTGLSQLGSRLLKGVFTMRVVIQQHQSLRRELWIIGLIVLIGVSTVVLLIAPGMLA